ITVEQQSVQTIDYNGTLYVYPKDTASDIEWGGYGTEIIDGNGADSDTDGAANTSAIVSQLGSDGHAAYVCDTLTAYGYSDWYLPAKHELNAMYQNKASIGGFISLDYYWSSTEVDAYDAWSQYFNDGNQVYYGKDNYDVSRVRCVRRD
uniref:Lcl domain-containing protein n=1 Tax=Methanohalobium sp. TaxID=2837493 RepID=UPI0025D05E7B